MTTAALQPVHVPAGTNAHHAPTLNVLGRAVGLKMTRDQTGGQSSSVETRPLPRQMPPRRTSITPSTKSGT